MIYAADTEPGVLWLANFRNLPGKDIAVYALLIDGQMVYVERAFADAGGLVKWLNRDFKIQMGLRGWWELQVFQLIYRNVDQYNTMDVVVIYQNAVFVLKVGTPADLPYEISYLPFDNGVPLLVDALEGKEVLSVQVGSAALIPGQWQVINNVLTIPGMTTDDNYITILAKQTAPAKDMLTQPVLHATITGSAVHFDFTCAGAQSYELLKSQTNSVADAVSIYTGRNAYYDYSSPGTVEYFFLYAMADGKARSNAARYMLNINDWIYTD